MADTLEIFGVEYTNVAGIIAKDDNGVDQTYTKGGGHLTQDQDGFLVIPPDGDGGGSSDFSTAQVTFICNASNNVDVELATIEEAFPPFVPVAQSNGGFELGEGDEIVASAILYKGVCSCLFPNANTLSGSGNVVIKDNKAATITGDCTITIS